MGLSPGLPRLVLSRLLGMHPVHYCEHSQKQRWKNGWIITHRTRTQCLWLDLLIGQSSRVPIVVQFVLQITSYTPCCLRSVGLRWIFRLGRLKADEMLSADWSVCYSCYGRTRSCSGCSDCVRSKHLYWTALIRRVRDRCIMKDEERDKLCAFYYWHVPSGWRSHQRNLSHLI